MGILTSVMEANFIGETVKVSILIATWIDPPQHCPVDTLS